MITKSSVKNQTDQKNAEKGRDSIIVRIAELMKTKGIKKPAGVKSCRLIAC
jgi:hypothetical protein